jgi:lactoylglutathione lyase
LGGALAGPRVDVDRCQRSESAGKLTLIEVRRPTVSETKTKTGLRIRDVGVVGVPVTDQDHGLEFYVGKLGFDVRVDAPMPTGGRWIMLELPSATTVVALVPATEHAPAGVETGIRFTTTDAEADHADMVAAGVDVDEVLHWPGVPAMFKFRDQDGNALEVVEAF